MKLDKRHLIASLVLLVGSILYNVWVYTRPAAPVGGAPTAANDDPMAFQTAPQGDPAAGAVDPMQVVAPPDVALDRLPEWPRDPFVNLQLQPEVVDEVTGVPEPVAPAADPVVASILYSPDRRLAMMNGKIVRVGDQVGIDRIVDILPNGVIVESAVKGRRTLPLEAPSTTVARP
jgi:hypothetical protein